MDKVLKYFKLGVLVLLILNYFALVGSDLLYDYVYKPLCTFHGNYVIVTPSEQLEVTNYRIDKQDNVRVEENGATVVLVPPYIIIPDTAGVGNSDGPTPGPADAPVAPVLPTAPGASGDN